MWGSLLWFKAGDTGCIPDYCKTAVNLPSPLSDAFDRAYFNNLIDDKTVRLSVKAFLATEQRIPGLRNGVLQDII